MYLYLIKHLLKLRKLSSCWNVSLCYQLLARLLKSARPEDLETANRLIKSTIKEVRRAVEVKVVFAVLAFGRFGFHLCVCFCVAGAGEGRESVKAWIDSEGGGEQHQTAQRSAGAAHNHWNLVTAEWWSEGMLDMIQSNVVLQACVKVLWVFSCYRPLLACCSHVWDFINCPSYQ